VIYTFILLDKAGSGELRRRLKDAHRAYTTPCAGRIAFAGRLVGDDGRTKIGSLIAMEFPDREAAMQWLRDEPFHSNGLYASVQVQAFLNAWPQRVGFPPPVTEA